MNLLPLVLLANLVVPAFGEGSGVGSTPPGENSGSLKKASPDISATSATPVILSDSEESPVAGEGSGADGEARVMVRDGLLSIERENFKLWGDIRFQADAGTFFGAPGFCNRTFDGGDNQDHIGSGIILRRTRVAIKSLLYGKWFAQVEAEVSARPELTYAFLAYKGIPYLTLKGGLTDEDFSMQQNASFHNMTFLERSMAVSLAPSIHVGFDAQYSRDWLWLGAGVFGPEAATGDHVVGVAENNRLGRDEGLSWTGKIAFRPLYKNPDAGLHIGGAFSRRDPKLSSGAGYKAVRYSSRNATAINTKKYLDTGIIGLVDHERAWIAELAGFWKGLYFENAYIARGAFLENGLGHQWARGFYSQASYLLFGSRQKFDYDEDQPAGVDFGANKGDLELAARFDWCDLNTAAFKGGSCKAFTLGVNWFPTHNVKLMLNWTYNNNDHNADGAGTLTSGDTGVDYHMLAMRLQVRF